MLVVATCGGFVVIVNDNLTLSVSETVVSETQRIPMIRSVLAPSLLSWRPAELQKLIAGWLRGHDPMLETLAAQVTEAYLKQIPTYSDKTPLSTVPSSSSTGDPTKGMN